MQCTIPSLLISCSILNFNKLEIYLSGTADCNTGCTLEKRKIIFFSYMFTLFRLRANVNTYTFELYWELPSGKQGTALKSKSSPSQLLMLN